MNARQAIRNTLDRSEFILKAYLEDLSDAELLERPVPGANHIAWQLGHLIKSEHQMVEAAFPGSMPPLPEGFGERYTAQTAALDDPAAFASKAEYLRLRGEQRAATLAVLDRITDEDLDRPAPEAFRHFLGTVGDLLMMQGLHGLMHAGQWAVARRKLGRKPLF
jgi:uncharacterized damage-inducible protein DinB